MPDYVPDVDDLIGESPDIGDLTTFEFLYGDDNKGVSPVKFTGLNKKPTPTTGW